MEEIFSKLYQMKSLNKEEAFNLFNLVNKKKLNDIQLAVILILMKIKGESINEILGAIKSFTKHKKQFPISNKYIFSDITGTGGDKSNGMNISTISALVAASCGFKIAKHCNYNITGKIGSSNFLEKLGINLHLSAVEAQKNLDYLNICFLLAPLYYKGFKFSTKVRKTLRTRTIFNLIGPLLNPSKPTLTVIGVYKKNFMLPMAKVLKKLKYQRAILIHSKNNDEITLSGHNDVIELKNNQILSYQLYPKDFGLNICSRSHFLCNTPEEIFQHSFRVLQGEGLLFHKETVAANVAILLKVFGNENLKENTEYALKQISSGSAYQLVLKLSEKK